jgi:peptidyl-prolyl cis-trans isomerase-like protein 2
MKGTSCPNGHKSRFQCLKTRQEFLSSRHIFGLTRSVGSLLIQKETSSGRGSRALTAPHKQQHPISNATPTKKNTGLIVPNTRSDKMVKKQREKQYQSAREHKRNSQLRSGSGILGGVVQRKLPFKCCALTLTPFVNPVCNAQGIVFDNAALMEFLIKYRKDPVTGTSLTTRDIITLQMDQDEEGRWQCPILTKPFADHTKIVAILDKSSNEAYAYSYEAYKELNVKPKNWLDLTTGKKFSPKTDVLILNDPQNEDFQKQRDIGTFWHIQNSRTLEQQRQQTNVKHSVTATRIMEKIQEERKRAKPDAQSQTQTNPASKRPKIFSDDVTSVKYTSGKASGSFTSTAMDVNNENSTREATKEEILQAQFALMKSQKQKGYVRMITSLGDLLLELHCDIAPR